MQLGGSKPELPAGVIQVKVCLAKFHGPADEESASAEEDREHVSTSCCIQKNWAQTICSCKRFLPVKSTLIVYLATTSWGIRTSTIQEHASVGRGGIDQLGGTGEDCS